MNLTLEQVHRLLPESREVSPFRLRFGPYELPNGRHRGLRHPELIDQYADGLLAAGKLQELFSNTVLPDAVPVLIFHLGDYLYGQRGTALTAPGSSGPTILLPSRTRERDGQRRAEAARAAAVHECGHAYQFTIRRADPLWQEWSWFMEGTAMFGEEYVLGHAGSCTDFYCTWLDEPDVPLDHKQAWYEAGMFVRWLARRDGPGKEGVIGRLWEESDRWETPFAVIGRLIGPVDRLFHEFAQHAYYLDDPASPCYCPELVRGWGLRLARRRVTLPDQSGVTITGSVDHLATHYIRIDANERVGRIACTAEADGLAAQLSAHGPDSKLVASVSVVPIGALPISSSPRPDHHVVTISNGHGCRDRVPYTLTISGTSEVPGTSTGTAGR